MHRRQKPKFAGISRAVAMGFLSVAQQDRSLYIPVPPCLSLDDLVEIYLNNPGFHSSFEDFMDEWQEEDNAVECEF